jgi:hypothetical protein
MAQVALNWVANHPGVATVLIGATKQTQLQDNLGALGFTIPAELQARLDAVSAMPASYPYSFFTPGMQAMLAGAHPVGDKPQGYAPCAPIQVAAAGVGGVMKEG